MIIGNGLSPARGRVAARTVVVASLVSAVTLLGTPAAHADITPTAAGSFASAVAASGTTITGASFQAVSTNLPDPAPSPDGVSTTPLAGFPIQGSSYIILTTGDVQSADDAPPSTHTGTTTDLDGPNARGDSDFDVSILKINFTVGERMNCVSFDFRFFSEEFGEVRSRYNDAFIAELDTSDWTTSVDTITAPHNFAFDPDHKPITVNATNNTAMREGPLDTTYDGATPILTAAQAVTPGAHSLFLSIFDHGDRRLDSAVFVDNLVVGHSPNPNAPCVAGAAPKQHNITLTPPTASHQVGTSHTVTATVKDITEGPNSGEVIGGKVLFTGTGANSPAGNGTTNGSGVATFTYTGTAAGSDAITACFDADSDNTCVGADEPFASVAVTWTAPNGPPPTTAPPGNGGLPTTGGPIGLIAALGLIAIGLGVGAMMLVRRRTQRGPV